MTDDDFKIDVDKIVKHWIDTSDDDFETMLSLYNSKSYGWSLFLGHICVEKLLKVSIRHMLRFCIICTD